MSEGFADAPPRVEPNYDEKADIYRADSQTSKPHEVDELTNDAITDLYVPLPMDMGLPEETNILTFRAIFIGVILGALVNASNLYLGLKTGFIFGSAMFGAIFGYGIIKLLSRFDKVPIIGGYFGPQENSIIQSAATGSGSLGIAFVGGVPAMYQLGLLSENPADDFGKIVTITLCSAFFGLFFSTPLRKFFIVQVARELRLMFPTPTATALVIRNMHAGAKGAANAMKRLWGLCWSFLFAIILRITSQYAPGLLWDWHPMTWIHIWSGYTSHAMRIESWGWYIQLTPAFAGSGLLIGLNSALSMLLGSVLSWAIIGPVLVKYGEAVGKPWVAEEDDPEGHWVEYTRYTSLSGLTAGALPSPRYWLLWPGVFIMLCASMIELFIQWKAIWYAIRIVGQNIAVSVNGALQKRGKHVEFFAKRAERELKGGETVAEDPARPEDQVPGWIWAIGLVISVVVMMIIGQFLWQIHPGFSLLSLFLSFIFCFLAIQIGAVTDTTPISSASKASQLVMGAATSGGSDIAHNQRINLVSGIVAAGGASVASDLASDFRTGFLLRTPPVKQWIAQTVGLVVAVFLAPALFIVFAKAYPCVITPDFDGECAFQAPSVAAWAAVARAVTDAGGINIPRNSGIFAIVMGVFAMVQAVFRHYYLVGEREKYREYLPNWGAVALPMILPNPSILNTAAFGAIAGAIWKKYWPNHWELYAYAVATGFIAGEGLGGVVNAVITIAGGDGDHYGVTIACPAGICEA
ncbi:OPT superfamily oligopeptide transporter [Thozetella sp. PMI_491]|nr:OPT superfamily oligopeptide transporter [Thozetella sp. PMI_491]